MLLDRVEGVPGAFLLDLGFELVAESCASLVETGRAEDGPDVGGVLGVGRLAPALRPGFKSTSAPRC